MPRYHFLADPTSTEIGRITALYRQAGWWTEADDDPEQVARIVRGSHCFLVASTSRGIAGMGRAISDGASDAYIQDVTVDAADRGRGIGTEIVKRIVRRLRADGLHWIALIAENDSHPFYAPLGFRTMPNALPLLLNRRHDSEGGRH